ncbi:MAG: VWA domain-containing protein [Acidobacteriota bacterium]
MLGSWQTGMVRIDAVTTGDGIDHATFWLDDRPVLTKRRPPWNVELDLGDVPRSRVLRVELYDEAGEVLAADERMLNAGDHRFAVRLEEPRPGRRYATSLRAEANVVVPKGDVVERVEFYLDEQKISTLYQEPWVQPIVLPGSSDAVNYVRTVAYTPDGAMAEDLVFINSPVNLEQIDVEFVELYTLALDRSNRPVQDLSEADFTVFEDDVRQDVVRFERVENLPIHASILLDVSASMEGRLDQAREAAIHFFQQAIQPKDRATAITFNDHPNLAVDFTNDPSRLAAGLAGVKPERGTALYDALIFTLYYFNGVNGQRAVLLLSDGKDESSKYSFDDVLEYARRSGVSIYSIGLGITRGEVDARRKLAKLAEETGGRHFFLDDVAELSAVYDTIQRELRSRYLIAYQSSNTSGREGFRSIDVDVDRSGVEAKTLRGYYP